MLVIKNPTNLEEKKVSLFRCYYKSNFPKILLSHVKLLITILKLGFFSGNRHCVQFFQSLSFGHMLKWFPIGGDLILGVLVERGLLQRKKASTFLAAYYLSHFLFLCYCKEQQSVPSNFLSDQRMLIITKLLPSINIWMESCIFCEFVSLVPRGRL